jgi:hypothetical protein
MPRWATALKFVIPTGAQRRGGTCSVAFGPSETVVGESPSGSVSPSSETAGPLRYPGFPVELGALANFMRLSLRKAAPAATGECRVAGNPGYAPVGMTKWRAVAYLGSSGGGWTEHNSNQPAFVCPRSLQRIQQVAPYRSPFVRSFGQLRFSAVPAGLDLASAVLTHPLKPARKC